MAHAPSRWTIPAIMFPAFPMSALAWIAAVVDRRSDVGCRSGKASCRRGDSFDHSKLKPTAGDPRAMSAIWSL
jgi:hypothetical protein